MTKYPWTGTSTQPAQQATGKAYPWSGMATQPSETAYGTEFENLLVRIFPNQKASDVLSYAAEKPDAFLSDIQRVGWNNDTEALLRNLMPDVTNDQLREVFGTVSVLPTPSPIAPPFESVPFISTKTTTPKLPYPGVMMLELVPTKDYASVIGESLSKLPKQLAASILQATQGQGGASVVNKNWADTYISEANEDINQFVQDVSQRYPFSPTLQGLAQMPQSLSYSIVSMGAGLGAGAAVGWIPLPGMRVVAWGLGTAASGAVAYQMTSYQIMQQYLELKNEERIQQTGVGLTQEEENQLKEDFSDKAFKYGLWEAVPEAISNLAFARILTAPLAKVVGKSIATKLIGKIASIYGEELLTETITQKGQSAIEVEAGLRDKKITWLQAFQEIAPQTFLLTTIMAGAGQAIVSSSKAIQKVKTSLKKEIGESNPLYDDIITGIETEGIVRETAMAGWETITGEVPGVEFKPITTNVGKGYEILQNDQVVGKVSYGTTEAFGIDGIIMGRIDITETARRQGLASQTIDKVLSEAESLGVPLYTGMMEADGVKLFNALESRGVIKLTPSNQRMLGEVVTRGVPEYATTAMAEEGTITGEMPIKYPSPKAAREIKTGDYIELKGEMGRQPNALKGTVVGEGLIDENTPAWQVRQENGEVVLIDKEDAIGIPPGTPKWETTTGKVTPEVTGGIVPPTTPVPPTIPPIPPTAAKPTPSFAQRDKIIEQSRTVVERDRPGKFTNLLNRIPGIKQILQFERPGLLMKGENEKILVAHIAESAVRGDVAVRALPTRLSIIGELKDVFPAAIKRQRIINGGKVKIKFLGTAEQAKSPITKTLKDIADNPDLYDLTDKQKAVLTKLNDRNTGLLNFIKDNYGVEIGTYPVKVSGAFLSNIDISEDTIEAVGSEMRAIASGRARTRIWASIRERMAYDKTFKPELDVEKLIYGMDSAKGSMSAGETFRTVLAGKTRLEAIQETHPQLAKKMLALRGRLASLQGSAGTLDVKLNKAITTFLNSPAEDVDLADAQSALDVKLAAGIRKGMGIEDIQKEIDGVRAQIKALRPAWEAANLKPYVFVQQGIYRYFPAEQANIIRELLKVSNNGFLNFIENMRGTVFSGDLSPIIGVQTPVGILADPIGSLIQMGGGIKKAIESGNPLVSFTVEGLAKDIEKNPGEWAQFFSLLGRIPGGAPQEFAGGFLSKIPGFSKFTESTFLIVTRQTYNLYTKTWTSLVKGGMTELDAKVSASTIATQVFPLMSPEKLGQSKARHTLLRALPTSYSFIRKPAELYGNATKGFIKLITGQKAKTEEILSLKIILTMAATAIVVSALSQADRAKRRGESVEQAILDAINPDPNNGKFLSIMIGNTRIPIGGPYRALFRAIYPKKLSGVPVPLPFAGLPQYLWNRINPFMRVQLDLIRNQDYYGQKIRSGEIPEQIWRTLAYEFEGGIPLTAGSIVEALRTQMTTEEMITQAVGQFAGVNVITSKWYEVQSLREKYAKSDYNLPYDGLNGAQRDDLMRNHSDLKTIYDAAKNELLIRGADLPKVIALVTDMAIQTRDTDLNKAAQALLDGTITKYDYDKERSRIRPYYSGSRNTIWQIQTLLDPVQTKQIEDYLNESAKPEDKALDEYWSYYSQLIEASDLPIDWDTLNAKLDQFILKYSPEIQGYIKDNINAWIKDLPQPARSVEESRIRGIEDETWWDDYRGTPAPQYPWSEGTTPWAGTTKTYPWSGAAK
jgi:hypothetical protein